MYLGHSEELTKFNAEMKSIYHVCRFVCENIKPKIILDLGSRYGEGFDLFGNFFKGVYIFVEPNPKCFEKITDVIEKFKGLNSFEFFPGVLGEKEGTSKMKIFSSDNDQSSNLYTDRSGKYGETEEIEINVFPYEKIESESINFAKINIEGGEYDLIESGFFNKIQNFIMEVHNHEWIEGKSYKDILDRLGSDYDMMTYGNLNYKYCFIVGAKIDKDCIQR